MRNILTGILFFVFVMSVVRAADVIDVKVMTLDLAVDIAQGAIDACREDGYQIAVGNAASVAPKTRSRRAT